MADKTATLKLPDGKSLEFPVLSGSTGPDVVDIRPLYAKSGMFTYDPGFMSTASCTSAITYIDGDAGILLYRGYPIEQLAVHCDFLEVCYLLLNGELPNKAQKKEFVDIVTHHTMVHEQLARLYQGFRRDAHPMAVMVGVVGALSAFYHDALDINNPQHRTISAFRLIAKMPTIVSMSYKYSIGQPFIYPKNNLSYTANFMRMMFAVPAEEYKPNDVLVRLMGFGHRVYKNFDPRAKLMRETCHEVLNELGLHNDRLFKLALELERIALEDDYFVSRKLYPNVDFYSGIVQRALGIPVAMFTCIFSLARTVGWIAQWQEMVGDPEQKIGRPRQLYTGPAKRDVIPIDKRRLSD